MPIIVVSYDHKLTMTISCTLPIHGSGSMAVCMFV